MNRPLRGPIRALCVCALAAITPLGATCLAAPVPAPGYYDISVPLNGEGWLSGAADDGSFAAGTWLDGRGDRRMFTWTPDGGAELVDLPDGWRLSGVSGVSRDGSTVVGSVRRSRVTDPSNPSREPFVWTAADGFTALGTLSTDRFDTADASDLSADGSVIVGTSDTPDNRRGFRWTASTGMVDLGTLPSGDESGASAVSADGSVVAGRATTADPFVAGQMGRWTEAEGWRTLIDPMDFVLNAQAQGISPDGEYLVGSDDNVSQAVIWSEAEGLVQLPSPAGFSAFSAELVLDGAAVVIGSARDALTYPAPHQRLIWTRTDTGYEVEPLHDYLVRYGVNRSQRRVGIVSSLSADGRVLAGGARDTGDSFRPFLVVVPTEPVPEPTTRLLLVAGLTAVSACFRKLRT